MFSLVSGMYQAYLAPTQLNILVVGASGVGKTTVMERVKVTQFATKISAPKSRAGSKENDDVPKVPVQWLKQGEKRKDDQSTTTASTKKAEGSSSSPPRTPASTRQKDSARKSTTSANKKSSGWLCPAPSRYADAEVKSDEEEDEQASSSSSRNQPPSPADLMGPIPSPMPTRKIRSATTSSMESVDLVDTAVKVASCCVDSNPKTNLHLNGDSKVEEEGESEGSDDVELSVASSVPPSIAAAEAEMQQVEAAVAATEMQEYDLKANTKMLPLPKIRRTIGMNLSKLTIQGVLCHFWDLGGRMHELWERYYCDSDAIIFVWKTPSDGESEQDDDDSHDDDSSNARQQKPSEAALQQSLLEEVRSSIPDDVPFLVLGHLFLDPHKSQQQPSKSKHDSGPKTDVLYSTDRLLPHYHNPNQALFFANAANGQGIKSALEWLIPIAKRQLKARESRPVEEVRVDK